MSIFHLPQARLFQTTAFQPIGPGLSSIDDLFKQALTAVLLPYGSTCRTVSEPRSRWVFYTVQSLNELNRSCRYTGRESRLED